MTDPGTKSAARPRLTTRTRRPLTALLLASAVLLSLRCGGGGAGGGPTAVQFSTTSMAVIVDMRSSYRTKPAFKLEIDGVPVAEIDLTQSSIDCRGPLFGKCAIGGSVQDVKSGRHTARVTLIDWTGPISIWDFVGVVKITSTAPILKEELIDLESRRTRLGPGGYVEWAFRVDS